MKEVFQEIEDRINDAVIGEVNSLEVYTELARLERKVKDWKAAMLEPALDEFDRHGAKELAAYGCKISQNNTGRYDYSVNGMWSTIKAELKKIEEKMQIGKKMGTPYIDGETGEEFPMAEYKPNKTSLSIKIIL